MSYISRRNHSPEQSNHAAWHLLLGGSVCVARRMQDCLACSCRYMRNQKPFVNKIERRMTNRSITITWFAKRDVLNPVWNILYKGITRLIKLKQCKLTLPKRMGMNYRILPISFSGHFSNLKAFPIFQALDFHYRLENRLKSFSQWIPKVQSFL